MRDRGTFIAQQLHIISVEPHAVSHREVGPDHAERIHVGHERRAIKVITGDNLHFRFRNVRVQTGAEIPRQLEASQQEFVGAMVRDGRRHGEAHAAAVQLPAPQRLLHVGDAAFVGREAQPLDLGLKSLRQALHEARNGLVEADVGNHRRQNGAHADVGIGLADRLQSLDGWHGMQQTIPGVDYFGIRRRGHPGPADLRNGLTLHQDVGRGSGMAANIEHASAADHRHRRLSHLRILSSVAATPPPACCCSTTGRTRARRSPRSGNSVTPMTDKMISAPKATGTLKKAVDVTIRKPNPASALTNSPTTAPTTASETATLRPAKMKGIAKGSRMRHSSLHFDARQARLSSSSSGDTDISPVAIEITSGKKTTRTVITTRGNSLEQTGLKLYSRALTQLDLEEIPVIFPVTRYGPRRTVRSRLRPPPTSLHAAVVAACAARKAP